MWTCSLLKTNAKQALRGRYWRCFWICLVLGLVGVGGSSASTGGSRYTMDTVTGSDTAYDRVANYLDSLSYQMLMTILIVAVLAAVISLLWSILGLLRWRSAVTATLWKAARHFPLLLR